MADMETTDHAIRESLATEVLQPAIIEAALDKAIAILRTNGKPGPNRTELTRRLRAVETTLANLTDTAAKGGAVPVVLEALNRTDAERRAIECELAALRKTPGEPEGLVDAQELRRTLRGYLDDWHGLIRGNVTEARGVFALVLRERIPFTPIAVKQQPCYRLTVPVAFDRVLTSVVPMLRQGGFESRWGRHRH
jgi:hypothetical protein